MREIGDTEEERRYFWRGRTEGFFFWGGAASLEIFWERKEGEKSEENVWMRV